MKKYLFVIVFSLIILLPTKVLASGNTSVVISCSEASVGETFTCDLHGYLGDAYVSYISAKYDISSIFVLNNFKFAEGLSGSYESNMLQINSDHALNGQFLIGTFELKATREGIGSILVQNIEFVNNDSTYTAGANRVDIQVSASKTTVSIQTESDLDVPMLNNLYIVGYPIEFDKRNRHYTIDVPYDLDELYIMANAFEGYSIEGIGIVKLNKKGTTEINIVVKKDNYISNTYTIKVRKTYKNILWYTITGALFVALIAVIILSYISKKKVVESIYKDNPELHKRTKEGVLMNGQMVNVSAIPVKTNNESFRAVNTSNLMDKKEEKKVVKKVQVVTTKKEEHKVNTLDLTNKK